ncbi:MAG: 3',5'-cyclic-nucleotide phosphodiesterase [Thermodesulfobacteriota bacterium]|jgi:ribonuclease BN (tRNA processing enzyme)
MKIKVLGCSGAEFPGNNLSCFLVDGRILFDAGSITNVLNEKSQLKIENIFITHAHLDHVKGIPFLADNIAIRNKRHKVNVFSISPIINRIKKNLLNSLVWPDFALKGTLKLIELKTGQPIKIGQYTISPVRVNHSVPAVGYLVENKKKRCFFYTGDTGPSAETWKNLERKEIHCLIIEVTFPNRMEETALKTGHLTPQLLKKEILKIKYTPEKICVSHLKPQYFKTIETELSRLKINNLRVLRDEETITV